MVVHFLYIEKSIEQTTLFALRLYSKEQKKVFFSSFCFNFVHGFLFCFWSYKIKCQYCAVFCWFGSFIHSILYRSHSVVQFIFPRNRNLHFKCQINIFKYWFMLYFSGTLWTGFVVHFSNLCSIHFGSNVNMLIFFQTTLFKFILNVSIASYTSVS